MPINYDPNQASTTGMGQMALGAAALPVAAIRTAIRAGVGGVLGARPTPGPTPLDESLGAISTGYDMYQQAAQAHRADVAAAAARGLGLTPGAVSLPESSAPPPIAPIAPAAPKPAAAVPQVVPRPAAVPATAAVAPMAAATPQGGLPRVVLPNAADSVTPEAAASFLQPYGVQPGGPGSADLLRSAGVYAGNKPVADTLSANSDIVRASIAHAQAVLNNTIPSQLGEKTAAIAALHDWAPALSEASRNAVTMGNYLAQGQVSERNVDTQTQADLDRQRMISQTQLMSGSNELQAAEAAETRAKTAELNASPGNRLSPANLWVNPGIPMSQPLYVQGGRVVPLAEQQEYQRLVDARAAAQAQSQAQPQTPARAHVKGLGVTTK